jgi:heterodisulfide reductase subunit A-like polyferredoxin
VLDWGGDWSGLDAAEALAVRGRRVALASASPVAGETLHQYQRAAYLARLDRRDVALLPHRELAVDGDGVVLRNIYSGRLAPLPEGTTTLVLAQGRVPDDDLWPALEGRPGVIRVGDVLGPRSMEEAVLEGGAAVLAAAR